MGLSFSSALRLKKGDVITLVGAGGKTSILKILAGELEKNLLITTTTHIQTMSELKKMKIINKNFGQITSRIVTIRKESNEKIYIASKIVSDLENGEKKVKGISPDWVDELWNQYKNEIFIIEGDGSALRPIKAPVDYEPVVPNSTSHLLVVMGMRVFGKKINKKNCHRINKIKNLARDNKIDKELIIKLFTANDTYGFYQDQVENYIPVLNQLDSCDLNKAEQIGKKLLARGVKKVILTDTLRVNPIIKILTT